MTYTLNADSVVNRAKISGQARRADTSQQTVAWMSDKPSIVSSGHLGFWVAYVDPVENSVGTPATSLQVPVASSDWQLNTSSDGTGTDRTSSGSLNITMFGEAAVCSLYNGAAETVYLTKFQIRGFSVRQQPLISVQHDGSSSQALYGKHEFTLESDFIVQQNYAKDYAKYMVDDRSNPAPDISVAISNQFPDVLARSLGDLVSLVESHTAVNSQWSVVSVVHDVSFDAGLQHVMTLGVKFYSNKPWLVLDDPVRGVLDGNRELAF